MEPKAELKDDPARRGSSTSLGTATSSQITNETGVFLTPKVFDAQSLKDSSQQIGVTRLDSSTGMSGFSSSFSNSKASHSV